MKPLNYLFIICAANLLLSGCGPDNNNKTKLFEDQRNALDKAKQIDNKVQQQTQEMQQNLEKQTQ